MKFTDILHMCSQNLFRRKSRTILTVLGVIVGCCSIVIMVSLGAGINEQNERTLQSMSDLTIINVYRQGSGGMGSGSSSGSSRAGSGTAKLDDSAIENIRRIPGVSGATGQMYMNYSVRFTASNGRYYADYGVIQAIDMGQLDNMGYKLTAGAAPARKGEVLAGQNFAYSFADKYRPEGQNIRQQPFDVGNGTMMVCNDNGCEQVAAGDVEGPFFDPMNTEIVMTVDAGDGSGGSMSGAGGMAGIAGAAGGASGSATPTNTFKLKTTGILKEDYSKGEATSNGIMMDIGQLKGIIAKVDKAAAKKASNYDQALVKVADLSQVADVEQQIKDMGFGTSSSEEMRKSLQEQSQGIQLALGGIGAVSFLVAAIGIANTMVMSVTERTCEIGIMKALGCYVRDIRVMFLGEASAIGLIGGLIGCVISALVSLIINLVSMGGGGGAGAVGAGAGLGERIWMAIVGGENVARISVIPWWLFVAAILFSMAVGLIAGFGPANKAVKIPALDAIKNEQ